jgi:hypothetical protein
MGHWATDRRQRRPAAVTLAFTSQTNGEVNASPATAICCRRLGFRASLQVASAGFLRSSGNIFVLAILRYSQ